MHELNTAEMSVVLITPDCYETIRKTVRHLRAQTVKDQLEIVIVAPSSDRLKPDETELKDFYHYRVVEVGEIQSTGAAMAAGMRQASAPVVVYAEEHAYPDPGWAEALIAAHRQPWAAVGPVIANANPDSMISWAHIFTDFGSHIEPAAGVADLLPSHQTSYKRAILLEYGPQLEAMLETEYFLHHDLRAKGYQLYREPGARTCHVNISLPFSHLQSEFFSGRRFGGERIRYGHWTIWRRLLYIGGGPLIPLVRLPRIIREIRRCGRQRELLPRVLPVLMMGLTASALGEMVGYAFGAGEARRQRLSIELQRRRHLRARDRQAEGMDRS